MTLRSARFSGVPELEAIVVDRSARLRRGSRGRGVVLVQQALLDLGESLPRFGADGSYGRETEQAVRSYQTKRKAIDGSVLVDGVVGKQTIGLLDTDIDALDSRAPGGEDVVHERRDVWVLSDENPWHPTIEWYARAVAAMQARDGADFADPTCWRHLAEAHGSSIPRARWRLADWALPYWNYSDPTRLQTRSLDIEPARIEVIENGATVASPTPGSRSPGRPGHEFTVRVRAPDPSSIDVDRLHDVVAAAKPAHLAHRVEVVAE